MSATRIILSSVYSVWLFLSVLFQCTLLYFILRHSPKSFRIFKWLLADSAIFQLVTILSCYFNQFGIISNVQPMLMESFGLCRHFDPRICFFTYLISVMGTYLSNTAIFANFYFKYRSIKSITISDCHIAKFVVIAHIPAAVIAVLKVWFYQEMLPFFNEASQNPQKYQSEEWSIFATITDTTMAFPSLNLAIAAGAVWHPIICSYLRRQILKEVNVRMKRHSAAKRAQHKTFVMGLTIQVVIPTFLYPLAYAIFYFYYLNGMSMPLVDLYNFVLIGVPPLVDPVVCLYFVSPFRKTARGWMGKSNSQVVSTSKAAVFSSHNKH